MCKEFMYRIKDGDSLISINLNFYTCKENVVRNNDKIDLYVGEWVIVKTNDYQTHIVKPAESLKDVSTKFEIDEKQIIKDNDLKNDKLFIGQILKIYKQ